MSSLDTLYQQILDSEMDPLEEVYVNPNLFEGLRLDLDALLQAMEIHEEGGATELPEPVLNTSAFAPENPVLPREAIEMDIEALNILQQQRVPLSHVLASIDILLHSPNVHEEMVDMEALRAAMSFAVLRITEAVVTQELQQETRALLANALLPDELIQEPLYEQIDTDRESLALYVEQRFLAEATTPGG